MDEYTISNLNENIMKLCEALSRNTSVSEEVTTELSNNTRASVENAEQMQKRLFMLETQVERLGSVIEKMAGIMADTIEQGQEKSANKNMQNVRNAAMILKNTIRDK